MIELGRLIINLALGLSVLIFFIFAYGIVMRNRLGVKAAQIGLALLFLAVTLATGVLLYAFLTHNFQIEYVANYSSTHSSLFYLITGVWAGQEGSLLFWLWLVSLFTFIVLLYNRDEEDRLSQTALSILTFIQGFFLLLVAVPASPFKEAATEAATKLTEGFGLNPLLQHPMMVLHPPTLFAGYSAYAVPFAFALASLIFRRSDDYWIKKTRWWTLFAWVFLGIGIILGAIWAYEELGWGGYWAWDPVENSSLIPWLVGTALIHSMSIYQKRKQFMIWTFSLTIVTFLLCIYGTLLTRSGVSPIHSFPATSILFYLLAFIVFSSIYSFALLWLRRDSLQSEHEVQSALSAESGFLINNIVFVMLTVIVLYGTSLPLFTGAGQAAGSEEALMVSADFYNRFCAPLAYFLLFVIALCPILSWRDTSLKGLMEKINSSSTHQLLGKSVMIFGGLSLVVAIGDGLLFLILNLLSRLIFQAAFFPASLAKSLLPIAGFLACLAAFFALLYAVYHEVSTRQRQADESFGTAFFSLLVKNKHRYGGFLAHLGVVIISAGIIGSAFYPTHAEKMLPMGGSLKTGNLEVKYENLVSKHHPNRDVVTARLHIFQNGVYKGLAEPSIDYFHTSPDRPTREVVIWRSFMRDMYFALAEFDDEGHAVIQVHINPLISWVWFGSLFLIAGAIFGMFGEKLTVKPIPSAPSHLKKKKIVSARKIQKRPRRKT